MGGFLKLAGQQYWQILPLGPTSYGDSPYQSFSTYAGNPYFIDLEELVEAFDYRHMSKSPAVFDIQKLKWMNSEYLKAMDLTDFMRWQSPTSKRSSQKT